MFEVNEKGISCCLNRSALVVYVHILVLIYIGFMQRSAFKSYDLTMTFLFELNTDCEITPIYHFEYFIRTHI